MRKAIRLKLTLWIEGEDEPAHDFARSSMQAVRELLAAARSRRPPLKVSIKKMVEDSGDDEDTT